jgi:Tol biopolymer transport system component
MTTAKANNRARTRPAKARLAALLATAIPAALIALAALPTSALAAFPGLNGRIVFASFRDNNGNLFATEPLSGAPAQRLTTESSDEAQPSFSPDGRRIAFRSNRDGNYEIFLMNAEGTGQTQLTQTPSNRFAAQPSWAPDGRHIVYRANPADNPELYSVTTEGTNVRRLTNSSADERYPVYSPDGGRIAFSSTRDGDSEIYTMDPDGTHVVQLTRNNAFDSAPAWSPDGTRIVFRSQRDGNSELYVMAADGTSQTRLTNSPFDEEEPDWSPDGSRIVFTSNRDSASEVYTMAADGSNLVRITFTPARDLFPDWQPLGSPVAVPKQPADKRAPRARVSTARRRSDRLHGRTLLVFVRCDEFCRVHASARIVAGNRTVARASKSRSLPAGRQRALHLRLSRAERHRVLRARAAGKRVRAKLRILLEDRAGNARTLRRTVRL